MKSQLLLPPSASAQATERILERSCFKAPGPRSVFDARCKRERYTPVSRLLDNLKQRLGDGVRLPLVLKLLCSVSATLALSSSNLFRLVMTACLLSIKVLDDEAIENKHYAQVCRVSLKELNHMERHFLALCRYKLYMSDHEFGCYLHSLVKETLRQPI